MPDSIQARQLTWICWLALVLGAGQLLVSAQQPAALLDPAAWGGDHVGKPVPAFTSGDECLFCHRDIGPAWPRNRHGQTIRLADPQSPALVALVESPVLKGLAAEVELLLGAGKRVRYLKRSEGHGRLDLLSVEWAPPRTDKKGQVLASDRPSWDSRKFGDSCAGCHATGVTADTRTFAESSLDCFACHGEVPDLHTTQGSLVQLSPKGKSNAAVVASICGQCHLRGGTARSTHLPYPNTFVAGDNLFRDFQLDLSEPAIQKLNPGDRHVYENVRAIVLLGREDLTCLSCHDVHKQSSQKHHRVANSNICLNCHGTGSKKDRVPYEVHSAVCGY